MPSMHAMVPNLRTAGPIVEVTVLPSRNAPEIGKRISAVTPVRVKALIDTGASGSVIQQGLLSAFDIRPVSATLIPPHLQMMFGAMSSMCSCYWTRRARPMPPAWWRRRSLVKTFSS